MSTKVLKRMISIICAVGMSASCATGFVSAVEKGEKKTVVSSSKSKSNYGKKSKGATLLGDTKKNVFDRLYSDFEKRKKLMEQPRKKYSKENDTKLSKEELEKLMERLYERRFLIEERKRELAEKRAKVQKIKNEKRKKTNKEMNEKCRNKIAFHITKYEEYLKEQKESDKKQQESKDKQKKWKEQRDKAKERKERERKKKTERMQEITKSQQKALKIMFDDAERREASRKGQQKEVAKLEEAIKKQMLLRAAKTGLVNCDENGHIKRKDERAFSNILANARYLTKFKLNTLNYLKAKKALDNLIYDFIYNKVIDRGLKVKEAKNRIDSILDEYDFQTVQSKKLLETKNRIKCTSSVFEQLNWQDWLEKDVKIPFEFLKGKATEISGDIDRFKLEADKRYGAKKGGEVEQKVLDLHNSNIDVFNALCDRIDNTFKNIVINYMNENNMSEDENENNSSNNSSRLDFGDISVIEKNNDINMNENNNIFNKLFQQKKN